MVKLRNFPKKTYLKIQNIFIRTTDYFILSQSSSVSFGFGVGAAAGGGGATAASYLILTVGDSC